MTGLSVPGEENFPNILSALLGP